MTVADFQKYLRALADAVGAAKGPNAALVEAAGALEPFGHHSMADFSKFLKLAEVTYRDGKLPIKPEPPVKRTVAELTDFIGSVQQQPIAPSRNELKANLSRFLTLTKADLSRVVKGLGYKTAPATKDAAIEQIVSRLTGPPIAVARSTVESD